jgi:hypothetical protein
MEAAHIPREIVQVSYPVRCTGVPLSQPRRLTPVRSSQIVLGYCDDTYSLAAARLVSRAWREGAADAPSRVTLTLRNSKQDVRQQLAAVRKVG